MAPLEKYSRYAFITITLVIFVTTFFIHPKWNHINAKAPISNAVSEHYVYLPALFIENDLKTLEYYPNIFNKYKHSSSISQRYHTVHGYPVCSKSIGSAILYSPSFFVGHLFAKKSLYNVDGYSKPYQFMIHGGSFIYVILGIFFMFLILKEYYADKVVAVTMTLIFFGSSYLTYAGFFNSIPQNHLLLLYSALILLTIQYYKSPSLKLAISIGVICGFLFLIRPIDFISILIPLTWGLSSKKISNTINRIYTYKIHILIFGFGLFSVSVIQIIYWKYSSMEWLPSNPNAIKYMVLNNDSFTRILDFKDGWLLSSPIFFISILGFYFLKSKKRIFIPVLLFSVLYTYLAFSAGDWNLNNEHGQRNMIQLIPILILPLGASLEYMFQKKYGTIASYLLGGLFIINNLWVVSKMQLGNAFDASRMTKAFYAESFLRTESSKETIKLYETDYIFEGFRKNVQPIKEQSFIGDALSTCESSNAFCLNESIQFTSKLITDIKGIDSPVNWLRAIAICKSSLKENDHWKYAQLIVECKSNSEIIERKAIRINPFLREGQFTEVYLDMKIYEEKINQIEIYIWNSNSKESLEVKSIKLESFIE